MVIRALVHLQAGIGMEDARAFCLSHTATVAKKKRSSYVRRPQKSSSLLFGSRDPSPPSYTSNNVKDVSKDDNSVSDGSLQRKGFYLNNPPFMVPSLNETDDTIAQNKSKKELRFYVSGRSRDRGQNALDVESEEYRTYSHLLAGPSSAGAEGKLKNLKFKVGGVTRTIHATSNVRAADISSSSNGSWTCQTSTQNRNDNHSPSGKERYMYRDEGGDVSRENSSTRKFMEVNSSGKKKDYVYLSRATRDNSKRFKPSDSEYFEEEEPDSSDGHEELKRKQKTLLADSPYDIKLEPRTKRQRALHSSKDGNGSSLVEFPDGLPPAPSRSKKQKLSEVEQQAKKAEAAQRRKMQVEKAARESETAAIRKILGLDADKKKAEKEKAQAEKAKIANCQKIDGNTVRWTSGPNGTVVTFPENVDLPSILLSKPCSYPPPREKCAGPSCTNPYKYRDSKSNLPLCSLQCYKAMQGSAYPVKSC